MPPARLSAYNRATMTEFDALLATATDPGTSPRRRVRAACTILDALHPKPIRREPRRPVARSPDELRAALEALHARRETLERP